MGIGVSGLMSGLDTESIISKLMELERRPITLLQKREGDYQAKISALGVLKGALSDLQAATDALADSDGLVSFKATSSDTSILKVTGSSSAQAGEYSVTVTDLAQAQELRSSAFTSSDDIVGTGTITLQVGSGNAVDITIDSSNQTLSGIAQAINEADTGVTAAVIHDGSGNYYLTLTSQKTGASNTIFMTIQDDDGNNDDASGLSSLYTDPTTHTLTETQAAKDAQLSINGIAVVRSENTITDLIDGVTIDLVKADAAQSVTIKVTEDHSALTSKVKTFVDKYNALIDLLEEQQSYDPSTQTAGPMLGDSTVGNLRYQLQNMLYEKVDGVVDQVNGLSALGIEVDRNGKLTLDESKLSAAVEQYRDDVVRFFSLDKDGQEGWAVQFSNRLDSYLDSSTGILSAKVDGLQSSIDSLEEQIESINNRLAKREENLRKQFEALELVLAELQSTSSSLEQQLTSLANLRDQIAKK